MKSLIIKTGKNFLSIIYSVLKLLPIKNRILFISMQSDNPSLDFELLEKEISSRDKNFELVFLCKKMESSLSKKRDYIKYVYNMFEYTLEAMYYLATSKVCVTESYCVPISFLKHKKNLKTIQIWHASGAVKKFGYQCLDTEEGKSKEIAELMCMHKNYDYVIAPSEVTKNIFAEAFNIEKDKIVKLGLPRLEYITNEKYDKSEEIYKEYPELENKKIILYVPTFRKGKNIDLTELLNCPIDQEKYKLIIKLHPLESNNVPEKYKINSKYTTYDLIKVADYIITDYSILSVEASILEKPIFLYLFDLEEYNQNRGLNINLMQELKTFTSQKINDIMDKIKNNSFDINEIIEYKNKYIEVKTDNSIKELADFILSKV